MAGPLDRCLCLAFVLVAALGWTAPARAAVPRSFFGVVPQSAPTTPDLDRMRGVVGTLRIYVNWFDVEPHPGVYEFDGLDRALAEAADRGIRALPLVYGSPTWLTGDPARPPLGSAAARAAWKAFLRRLVERYGAGGTFWRSRTRREPVREWQIWNEPNFLLFWRPRVSPRGYALLLHLAARAIRREDPGARILAAGVAPVEGGMLPWDFMRKLYRVPGVRDDFDVAALHPYSSTLRGIEYEVRQTRRAMARGGDGRKPLRLTELGTASGGAFPNPFDKGKRGQARYLRSAFGMVLDNRRRWRLVGADWFTWQDAAAPDPHCVFCQYAGLIDRSGRPKPAWWAFKGVVADATAKPVR